MANLPDERTVALEAEIERLLAENTALTGLVEVLEARIGGLEREAGRDSQNSGRPPSSDTLADKKDQAFTSQRLDPYSGWTRPLSLTRA